MKKKSEKGKRERAKSRRDVGQFLELEHEKKDMQNLEAAPIFDYWPGEIELSLYFPKQTAHWIGPNHHFQRKRKKKKKPTKTNNKAEREIIKILHEMRGKSFQS